MPDDNDDVFEAIPVDENSTNPVEDVYHAEAEHYLQEEQDHIAHGDYEAAREDAANAATYQSWADQSAPNQGAEDYNHLDWAVWEEQTGDEYAHDAEHYAAEGDYAHADQYADQAADHYDAADSHADAAVHTDTDTSATDHSSESE